MGIYLLGPLLTDIIFIFVMHHPDLVLGGYWFLLLGPLVEGSLGGTILGSCQIVGSLCLTFLGFTGAIATIHAYQADVTTEDNRSVCQNGLLMFLAMLMSIHLFEITYILTQPRIDVHRGDHWAHARFIAKPMDWPIVIRLLWCRGSASHLRCLCLDLPSPVTQFVLQTSCTRKIRKREKTRCEAS